MGFFDFLKSSGKSRQTRVISGSFSYSGESISRSARDALTYFKTDPLIFGACSNLAHWISASDSKFEYTGRGSGARTLAEVEEWATRISFRTKLRNWALTHVIFDDVFIELDFENKDFYILDSETMVVKYDKHGNVAYYEQRVNSETVRLPPEKVIHFKMNTAGSELLGISPLTPLSSVLKSKTISEDYTDVFFKRNATPRLMYVVPDTWSDDQVRVFFKMIKEMGAQSDLVVQKGVEVKHIGSPMTDMQFEKWLQYQREQILVGMGLFPILIGLPEGSNKSNSMVQFDAFRLRVRAVQNALEDCINTRLLPVMFPNKRIKFKFDGISLDEYKRKADIMWQFSRSLSNLVRFNIITPEQAKSKFDKWVSEIE